MTTRSALDRSPGDVLDGRYRLIERLGRGGFGDVWRAEELLPGGAPFRDVALKLLVPDFADAARWTEEAKLLASFRHPSLVTIFAAGMIEGAVRQPFVAMELLIGDTLLDVLARRRRVPWRRALAWARDTAAGLDVIHARGVIHLDLKPANLFLSQDGALKVLDFGISRRSTSALASIPPRPSTPPAGHGRSSVSISTMGRGNAFVTSRGIGAEGVTPRRGGFFASIGRTGSGSGGGHSSSISTTGRSAAAEPTSSTSRAEPAAPVPLRSFGASSTGRGAAPTAPPPAPSADLETAAFMAEQSASAPHEEKAGGESGSSGQKMVAGTPGFMAPEIIELAEPTAATDAYSLAVCLVLLTTGRFPQDVRDQPEAGAEQSALVDWLTDVRGATLRGEMRDLSADPARLPRGLVSLIDRLLSIDPAQRGVEPGSLRALFDEIWDRPYGIPDPPYAGLEPFSAEAEGTLFGREDDITRFGRELTYEPCIVLQGQRGAGKSSLARAGIVPDLARRGVDGKDDWVAVDITLGDDPDRAVAEALRSISEELEGAGAEALFAFCEQSAIGAALIVDPLDQIIDAPDERRGQAASLLSAIATSGKQAGIRLIGVVGDERSAALLESPMGPMVRPAIRYVSPPSAAAMDDIVLAPAELVGAEITDRDAVLADVQREMRAAENNLPFVSIALLAWWSLRQVKAETGEITLRGGAWREMGGVAGALAAHADAVIAAMDPSLHHVADEILLRLSTTAGAPVRWKQEDLIETLGRDAGAAPGVIEALARAHILRAQRGSVEIGHPALIKGWNRLTAARLREMDRLVFLERVREASETWTRADRPKDLLLQGALLREARERAAWLERGAAPVDRELVQASVKESRVRAAVRIAAAGAVVLAIVGGALVKRAYDTRQLAADTARKAAEQRAYTAEIVARARRTEDPFQRAAWIAEAMRRRSTDGSLPLDLASTIANIPRARFLTLDPITGPTFPWNDRWLIGAGSSGTLTIVDMQPADSDVIEDISLDADPESAEFKARAKRPKVIPLRPHDGPVVERVPFAFDTSFATRSVSGEVRVWRLRSNGTVSLAAVAPFRCSSSVLIAAAAPVLVCSTDTGIARWDLRRAGEGAGEGGREGEGSAVDRRAFLGTVLDVSPDGERVAATVGRQLLLWEPRARDAAKRESVTEMAEPALFARYSPRDRVVAVAHATSFEVIAEDNPAASLISGPSVPSPALARWDSGGLDIAICNATGGGDWHYLRKGVRPANEPSPKGGPCDSPPAAAVGRGTSPPPSPLSASDAVPEVAGRDLGTHQLAGGYRLPNGRALTRDLVLFSGGEPVGSMLHFKGWTAAGAEEPVDSTESAAAALRIDKTSVAFQIGEEVRVYDASSGRRARARKGYMLRRCADGRLLSWRREKDSWQVFDALGDAPGVALKREPGFVIGTDEPCSTFLTQRLDGAIVATPIPAAGASTEPAPLGRAVAMADGYVYAVSLSPARGPLGSGLWLALSSGAIARYDDKSSFVRLLGYATPRATAIGDGPEAGDVAYADATGVIVRRLGGVVERVLEGTSGASWEDLSVSPDGSTMLLCDGERISVLDIGKRELVSAVVAEGRSRFSPWDPDGSVLAWTFDRVGGAEGQIIPRGLPLATAVAEVASNLRVENRRLIAKP